MKKFIVDKSRIKKKFYDLIKKVLVITILISNISYYIPVVSFAEGNGTSGKKPALVPSILSFAKY